LNNVDVRAVNRMASSLDALLGEVGRPGERVVERLTMLLLSNGPKAEEARGLLARVHTTQGEALETMQRILARGPDVTLGDVAGRGRLSTGANAAQDELGEYVRGLAEEIRREEEKRD
jgi:hypothetical protein